MRIHTLASLSLTPGRIGGLVYRSRPTTVRILNQPTIPQPTRTRGNYSMTSETQRQIREFLVEQPK